VPQFEEESLKKNLNKTHAKIEDGEFIIPCKEIKSIFDKCIAQTLDSLEKEYAKSKYNKNPVTYMFLIGGFSQSEYLQKAVQKWCKSHGITLATVGDEMTTPVSCGAVSYGLNPGLITRRSTGKSYGLLLQQNEIKFLKYLIKKSDMEQTNHKTYVQEIALNVASSIIGKFGFFFSID
jgi:hypothetical protein